ncbi:Fe-S-cluster-containing dehydrogenase component [Ancylomarina subtilis]|uniref:Fe-S-cluster-containing dehydrogenase component n=1 Tax=Ancylomarina subtilis TaxID=1639035 RepID=A0A4Q7VLY0_9BACT|nr:4Fe-4S dicluster domain-containing protein [Ancylomarina subtilis]RZT97293.1 Fe-S-cluster-containing dehydrogenase component [Ancylomarina subtilis]
MSEQNSDLLKGILKTYSAKNVIMTKNAFIFNTNKCVGCMACVVGCSIENGTSLQVNWREVNCHNKIKHPGLPAFHFSLACNHCEEAPCMKNCPALAYTRDKETGAIIHHAEACIGCKYCTWACPYDAPKFNPKTQVVEKCNFCVDRISEGKQPACVQACPVGALSFGQEEVNEENHLTPGFVNKGIKPAIQLIPLRDEHRKPQIENTDAIEIDTKKLESYLPQSESKISLDKEWTLVLFTLAVAGLVSWQASHQFGMIEMPLIPFAIASILAIALSSLHIGKKLRMWRFILNLKGSWLSREIFSFSAFLGLTGLQIITENQMFGYAAMAFGLFSLISVDRVYKFLKRKDELACHSAMVSLTAMLLFAWLSNISIFIELIILLKGSMYIWRKGVLKKKKQLWFPVLSVCRILCLLVPYILWDLGWITILPVYLLITLTGELIDRAEFYYESDVVTPKDELRMMN